MALLTIAGAVLTGSNFRGSTCNSSISNGCHAYDVIPLASIWSTFSGLNSQWFEFHGLISSGWIFSSTIVSGFSNGTI